VDNWHLQQSHLAFCKERHSKKKKQSPLAYQANGDMR
jgi:hypothetical protein